MMVTINKTIQIKSILTRNQSHACIPQDTKHKVLNILDIVSDSLDGRYLRLVVRHL